MQACTEEPDAIGWGFNSGMLHAHILLGAKDLGMARLAQLITVFPAVQGSGMETRPGEQVSPVLHIVCLTSDAGDC